LIALCALAREESRGAHLRLDRPTRDPALDHRHAVVAGEDQVLWEAWE
jgi:L-aspartate oxidase